MFVVGLLKSERFTTLITSIGSLTYVKSKPS